MVSPELVLSMLYVLVAWSTVSGVVLVLTRRDVKLGLKKWWYWKTRKQPIKVRYHGPDKTVTEYVLPTKGRGETITIGDKKFFFVKASDGSTFFLDEEAIRRTDDGINEISYNYKSIMPLYPEKTLEEAERERRDVVERIKSEKRGGEAFQGVQLENLAQYTDPKRLNRLIEFIKLAAKTEALGKTTDLEKYVKYSLYAGLAAAAMAGLVWYTMDNRLIPMLQAVSGAVQSLGQTVLNL